MNDLAFSKIRKIMFVSWGICLCYFLYIVQDYEGRFLSDMPLPDKIFSWIFALHSLALAEVAILSIKGVQRTPRTVFFTLFTLIGYVIVRIVS